MAIEVFNRFEKKYRLGAEDFQKAREIIDSHMSLDSYCARHSQYTVSNIYYDTSDSRLIRNSLSKPDYKEKLRLRSYGVPESETAETFLEIKKKVHGLVNKRRTALHLNEAYDFLETGIQPVFKEYMNKQVLNELEFFLLRYRLEPKTYIAYERIAYFENENDDLRISFDTNIRTRHHDLRLESGDYGKKLLPDGVWIMEIKTSTSMPLWVSAMLSKLELRHRSFSKYGVDYENQIRKKRGKEDAVMLGA